MIENWQILQWRGALQIHTGGVAGRVMTLCSDGVT